VVKIGIIGGSGLDDPKILKHASEIEVETPYGSPTSNLTCGVIEGVEVVIIARHGKNHSIFPSRVNFRSNIWALKEQGCTHVLGTTAVGSLREEIKPGHLVFPNQFIDHTKKRELTFFDEDVVVHTPMAEPFCSKLIELCASTAKRLKIPFHKNKTVITIEGPRFSTRAESYMFRSWNADVINMSTVPEVNLARERKMHYAAIAMSTDYDCWREGEEAVTWETIVHIMRLNSDNVIKLFLDVIPQIGVFDDICVK